MLNHATTLQFSNISNFDDLFSLINECHKAIYLRFPNGKTKDIRKSFMYQNYISWILWYHRNKQITIYSEDAKDHASLVAYLEENI